MLSKLGSFVRPFGVSALIFGLITGYFQIKPIQNPANQDIIALLSILISLVLALAAEVFYLNLSTRQLAKGMEANVRIVTGSKRLNDELYVMENSVVRSADDCLVVTGSRSRDEKYLIAIENKVTREECSYVRILVGPPLRSELSAHLSRLEQASRVVASWDPERAVVVEAPMGGDWPERFICANGKKAIIILQSPNAPLAYDTGLVIEDEALAGKITGQLRAFAENIRRNPSVKDAI